MNAYRFIDLYGIDKAKRVLDNIVYQATYYSDKTGSYYSSHRKGSVNLKDLGRAISEYKSMIQAKESYETRLRHWNASVNKDLINDH